MKSPKPPEDSDSTKTERKTYNEFARTDLYAQKPLKRPRGLFAPNASTPVHASSLVTRVGSVNGGAVVVNPIGVGVVAFGRCAAAFSAEVAAV